MKYYDHGSQCKQTREKEATDKQKISGEKKMFRNEKGKRYYHLDLISLINIKGETKDLRYNHRSKRL